MAEAVTINNEERAILCDIVSGWGVKQWSENSGATKTQALNRLIAHGYVRLRLLPLDTTPPLRLRSF